jgi:hypothetical protein
LGNKAGQEIGCFDQSSIEWSVMLCSATAAAISGLRYLSEHELSEFHPFQPSGAVQDGEQSCCGKFDGCFVYKTESKRGFSPWQNVVFIAGFGTSSPLFPVLRSHKV